MKRIGVVLSGCGVFDGSEIHESVFALFYLAKAGVDVQCFAPDKPQLDVVDHYTQEPEAGASRGVLSEAARISRGKIRPLSEMDLDSLDGLVFPGGFGAAKNLSAFAAEGPAGDVDPTVGAIIRQAVDRRKPIGAICIAPVVVAKALEGTGVAARLTVGTDEATQEALAAMGATPVAATVGEVVVDETLKIVSTPAYMLAQDIVEVASGIEALVKTLLERLA